MTNLLIITILSQWLIAIVFLATGVPKALDNPGFAKAIRAYKLVPVTWSWFIARSISTAELTIGVLLIAGLMVRPAAVGSVVLLGIFVVAISINLARGRRELSCGCGGDKHTSTIGWGLIGRDVLLMSLGVWVTIFAADYGVWYQAQSWVGSLIPAEKWWSDVAVPSIVLASAVALTIPLVRRFRRLLAQ